VKTRVHRGIDATKMAHEKDGPFKSITAQSALWFEGSVTQLRKGADSAEN
jgi:hypothetical protein